MKSDLFDVFYASSGVCSDTRNIQQDCLFICLKGSNFNGNLFASNALEIGASHVIVDEKEYFVDNGKMTLVPNCQTYLQELASFHRDKFEIPVIGITGSNGKTTTKELINAVLSRKYKVLATEGNLNNHLGVPFTLLRLKQEHQIAIVEMGANRFKDIEELCNIAKPTHGIITNIGKAHLEGFGGFAGVLKTKKELYDSIEKRNGTLFYNSDDSVLKSILPSSTDNRSYGTSEKAAIRGKLQKLDPFVQMQWTDRLYESEIFHSKLVGEYNFYNFLAAIAIGTYFDVDRNEIALALERFEPTNKRSQIKKTTANTLILDCYNANPTSMSLALKSFGKNETELKKMAILGGMKELGESEIVEHQNIVHQLDSLDADVILVGQEFSDKAGYKHFMSTEDLIEHLKQHPISNHLVLLKGSRSIGLEKLEEYL